MCAGSPRIRVAIYVYTLLICSTAVTYLLLSINLVIKTTLAGFRDEYQSCSIYTDVNECTTGTHNCDLNADCADSIGSFSCTCYSGYEKNGSVCTSEERYLAINKMIYTVCLNCIYKCMYVCILYSLKL